MIVVFDVVLVLRQELYISLYTGMRDESLHCLEPFACVLSFNIKLLKAFDFLINNFGYTNLKHAK